MSVAVAQTPEGLRDMYGRGMNNSSDAYKLPADKKEQERLTVQHRIWKLTLGGLYPAETEAIISRLLAKPSSGAEQPAVLDLGCGSGIWAVEIAEMYPHVKVVGLDLAAPVLHDVPANCSFAIADATKDLDAYIGHFNVIHCRCVAGHVQDRAALVRNIATLLRPGGLLLLADGNQYLYNSEKRKILPADISPTGDNTGRLWLSRWFLDSVEYMNLKSPERVGGEFIGTWLRGEEQFEFLDDRTYFSPVNWDGDGMLSGDEIGRLGVINFQDFLKASRPLLLASGLSASTVDDWFQKATEEIINPPMHWYVRWDLAWGIKKA